MTKLMAATTLSGLCRNKTFSELMNGRTGNKYLEMGVGYFCGMLEIMRQHGFKHGVGIDFSEDAINSCKEMTNEGYKDFLCEFVVENVFNVEEHFDYILMFEVLEHVDDDTKMLSKIYELTNSGGCFIMSVPAKMKLWSYSDTYVGHVRRYERTELVKKLKMAGFKINKMISYGFPILRISNKIGSFILKTKQPSINLDRIEKTKKSNIVPVARFRNNFFINIILHVQYVLGSKFDWGTGYMVICQKVQN